MRQSLRVCVVYTCGPLLRQNAFVHCRWGGTVELELLLPRPVGGDERRSCCIYCGCWRCCLDFACRDLSG